jgi:predicted nuclease with TOPRIM domain
MRKTLKSLEEEVARLKGQNDVLESKYWEVKKEMDKDSQTKMSNLYKENRQTEMANSQLLEVLRWIINPDTARIPFNPVLKKDEVPPNYNDRIR